MENININLPAACYNVEKILGVQCVQGNQKNYKVQWAPSWVSEIHLVGCTGLIQQFLDKGGDAISNVQDKVVDEVKEEEESSVHQKEVENASHSVDIFSSELPENDMDSHEDDSPSEELQPQDSNEEDEATDDISTTPTENVIKDITPECIKIEEQEEVTDRSDERNSWETWMEICGNPVCTIDGDTPSESAHNVSDEANGRSSNSESQSNVILSQSESVTSNNMTSTSFNNNSALFEVITKMQEKITSLQNQVATLLPAKKTKREHRQTQTGIDQPKFDFNDYFVAKTQPSFVFMDVMNEIIAREKLDDGSPLSKRKRYACAESILLTLGFKTDEITVPMIKRTRKRITDTLSSRRYDQRHVRAKQHFESSESFSLSSSSELSSTVSFPSFKSSATTEFPPATKLMRNLESEGSQFMPGVKIPPPLQSPTLSQTPPTIQTLQTSPTIEPLPKWSRKESPKKPSVKDLLPSQSFTSNRTPPTAKPLQERTSKESLVQPDVNAPLPLQSSTQTQT